MTSQRHPVPPTPPDLETTAELPALDVTGYEARRQQRELSSTDTWVAPTPGDLQLGKRDASASLASSRPEQEPSAGLAATLREFEARLAARDERVAALEGELESARLERFAAEQRAEALGRELTDARVALSAARAQIAELTRRVETREAEARTTLVRDHSLEARLAERERELARVGERLRQLERQASAHLEALQTFEGRRGVLDTLLRDLDSELSRRDSRVAELQRELDARKTGKAAIAGQLDLQTDRDAPRLDVTQLAVSLPETSSAAVGDVGAQGATRLLIRADGDGEVVHVLGRKTSIGRTPENDVRIDTTFVSRHHAMILAGPLQTIVEDLNSTNGVLVNGQRITRQSLNDGDTLVIGKTELRFAVHPAGDRRTPR